jgi:hypothetical protein
MRTIAYASLIALGLTGCKKPEEPRACVPVLPGWLTKNPPGDLMVANQVQLAGNGILWNGVPIDEQTLIEYSRQLAPRTPIPFLVFDPGSSPNCSFARQVRDILDQNYPCHQGACGQGPATNFIPRFNAPREDAGH